MTVARYVALLRGINLGKRNKVAMAELRAALDDLGYRDVTTYIQSGNVVFAAEGTKADDIERAIQVVIMERFDLDIRVLVRTAFEMRRTVARNPYPSAEAGTLHVTFLAAQPTAAAVAAHATNATGDDEFELVGRELYLHLPHGFGRSKLASTPVERTLKVTGTTRNWRTVTQLADMASAAGGSAAW